MDVTLEPQADALPDFPCRRLVVVSNRLPFAVEGSGRSLRLRRTVGGLVTATGAFLRWLGNSPGGPREVAWIGWPGALPAGASRAEVSKRAAAQHGAVPVYLDPDEVRGYYDGFSNGALWPLFHMFPGYVDLDDANWASYRAVNERFRDVVVETLQPGDALWIHDFHLMLLPALVREAAPATPISFFLHVPFPPFEVLRVLPDAWARELVGGVLGADVIGFHTYDYVRNFLRSAERLLGVSHQRGVVRLHGREAAADAFPIGVDFERFDGAAKLREVTREVRRLDAALGGRRVVLSVDRLDYTKGVLGRLQAFAAFLESHPEWRGRVSLVAVVVPSRVDVELYRTMRTRIEQLVGHVNGRFGDVEWTPVLYQYRALGFARLAALYRRSDVALVTPLRDGMNLIAKEYVASRPDETGVLVLSDTAGAARELGEAMIVNPYHVGGLAEAIAAALEMPTGEQRRRNHVMRERLRRYDVVRWGREQFARLADVRSRTEELRARSVDDAIRARAVAAYRRADRRLLFLDYDGTLTPIVGDPSAAVPDADLLALLDRLAADPANEVVLMSGRDWRTLEAWFGARRLALVAEHGVRLREPGEPWSATSEIPKRGKQRVRTVMQVFADRLPGSFLEEKASSVAWHYRGADPELAPVRAGELVDVLRNVTASTDLQVLRGRKVIEVKPAGASKGAAALRWLSRGPHDFVLAAGDDETDESAFAVMPQEAVSIRVGPGRTRARFSIEGPAEMRDFLRALADGANPRERRRKSVRDAD